MAQWHSFFLSHIRCPVLLQQCQLYAQPSQLEGTHDLDLQICLFSLMFLFPSFVQSHHGALGSAMLHWDEPPSLCNACVQSSQIWPFSSADIFWMSFIFDSKSYADDGVIASWHPLIQISCNVFKSLNFIMRILSFTWFSCIKIRKKSLQTYWYLLLLFSHVFFLGTVTQKVRSYSSPLPTRGSPSAFIHTKESRSHLYRPPQTGPLHLAYLPKVSEIWTPGRHLEEQPCDSDCACLDCTAPKEDKLIWAGSIKLALRPTLISLCNPLALQ